MNMERCAGLLLLILISGAVSHPLDDYIQKPDDNYAWVLMDSYLLEAVTVHVLNVTSQGWMDGDFSSQPIWWHYVTVVIPDELRISDQAALFVGIGQTWHEPPNPDDDPFIPLLSSMAEDAGAVMTMVSGTPNQPIVFNDDPSQRERTEDAIIAWTWAKYMNSTGEEKNPEMLLYFPMVKGIVKSMDAITDFCSQQNEDLVLDKYVLTGPSKRGWTTWLTAAVDPRVVGILPQVLTCLDLMKNFKHHQRSLGGWSYAIDDYRDEGVLARMDTPEADEIKELQDPLVFVDRYTMPKMIIKASKDEFFMNDDTQFWLDQMPGSTNMWVLENSMHIMVGHWERLAQNTANFFVGVHQGFEWPQWSYTMEKDLESGSIDVTLDNPDDLLNITVWYADTLDNERRDFRWMKLREDGNGTIPTLVRWREDTEAIEDLGDGEFRVSYDAPEGGLWRGFFFTLTMIGPEGRPVEFSTEVNIIPDLYLYEECEGPEECHSVLV